MFVSAPLACKGVAHMNDSPMDASIATPVTSSAFPAIAIPIPILAVVQSALGFTCSIGIDRSSVSCYACLDRGEGKLLRCIWPIREPQPLCIAPQIDFVSRRPSRTRKHRQCAHLNLTPRQLLDSYELEDILRIPLGSYERNSVVRTTPCFDDFHAQTENASGNTRS